MSYKNSTKSESKFSESKNSDNHDFKKTQVRKYIHDIRNIKLLSNDELDNISEMSHNDKMELIKTYNAVMDTLKELLDK
jgi:BRCT domain type II-containing protein